MMILLLAASLVSAAQPELPRVYLIEPADYTAGMSRAKELEKRIARYESVLDQLQAARGLGSRAAAELFEAKEKLIRYALGDSLEALPLEEALGVLVNANALRGSTAEAVVAAYRAAVAAVYSEEKDSGAKIKSYAEQLKSALSVAAAGMSPGRRAACVELARRVEVIAALATQSVSREKGKEQDWRPWAQYALDIYGAWNGLAGAGLLAANVSEQIVAEEVVEKPLQQLFAQLAKTGDFEISVTEHLGRLKTVHETLALQLKTYLEIRDKASGGDYDYLTGAIEANRVSAESARSHAERVREAARRAALRKTNWNYLFWLVYVGCHNPSALRQAADKGLLPDVVMSHADLRDSFERTKSAMSPACFRPTMQWLSSRSAPASYEDLADEMASHQREMRRLHAAREPGELITWPILAGRMVNSAAGAGLRAAKEAAATLESALDAILAQRDQLHRGWSQPGSSGNSGGRTYYDDRRPDSSERRYSSTNERLGSLGGGLISGRQGFDGSR